MAPSRQGARGFSAVTPFRLQQRPRFAPPSPHHFISDSAGGNVLSPWHQIPLFLPQAAGAVGDAAAYMVTTIPRHSTAALRLSLTLPYNPLVQDLNASGSERYFGLRSLANMGELPQTYEDAEVVDPATGARGSGGTLQVLEIGGGLLQCGAVASVRIVGALPLLEGNATAWKVRPGEAALRRGQWVARPCDSTRPSPFFSPNLSTLRPLSPTRTPQILAVQDSDPLAASLTCITQGAPASVTKLAADILQWLQLAPVTEGRPPARLVAQQPGSGSPWLGREEALKVLHRSHKQWKRLVEGQGGAAQEGMYTEGTRAASSPWVVAAPQS